MSIIIHSSGCDNVQNERNKSNTRRAGHNVFMGIPPNGAPEPQNLRNARLKYKERNNPDPKWKILEYLD
jgi:hypothetical protein